MIVCSYMHLPLSPPFTHIFPVMTCTCMFVCSYMHLPLSPPFTHTFPRSRLSAGVQVRPGGGSASGVYHSGHLELGAVVIFKSSMCTAQQDCPSNRFNLHACITQGRIMSLYTLPPLLRALLSCPKFELVFVRLHVPLSTLAAILDQPTQEPLSNSGKVLRLSLGSGVTSLALPCECRRA
jgi:hypothetical protein